MADEIKVGDRVEVFLSGFWNVEGWFSGEVARIDPYTTHRNFIWVRLDENAEAPRGSDRLISVLNLKNIRKI